MFAPNPTAVEYNFRPHMERGGAFGRQWLCKHCMTKHALRLQYYYYVHALGKGMNFNLIFHTLSLAYAHTLIPCHTHTHTHTYSYTGAGESGKSTFVKQMK